MKKIFYWSPHLSNVATIKNVINSAKSLKRFNDKEYEMKLLNALEEAIKKRTITYTNLDGNFVRREEAANFDKSKISYNFICYPNGVAEGNYNTKFFQKNLFDGKSEDLFDEYLDPTWDNQLSYIEFKHPQCYEEFTKNYEDNYFRDNL